MTSFTMTRFLVLAACAALAGTFAHAQDFPTILDAPTFVFTTSTPANWEEDALEATVGSTSLKSPHRTGSTDARLATSVEGPATVSFWWRASTLTRNSLKMNVGTEGTTPVTARTISGNSMDWRQESVNVPIGTHTIEWHFDRTGSGGTQNDLNAVWLDGLSVMPRPGFDHNVVIDATGMVLNDRAIEFWDIDETDAAVGTSSLKSAWIASSVTPVLEADLTGPGTLSWWWKAPNPTNLSFRLMYPEPGTVPFAIVNITGAGHRWQRVSIPIPAGERTLEWRSQSGGPHPNAPVLLDGFSFVPRAVIPYATVLDAPSIDFDENYDEAWDYAEDATAVGGTCLINSWVLTREDEARLETSIDGPATIAFRWRLASPSTIGTLSFDVDGVTAASLSRCDEWVDGSIDLPPGDHTVAWHATGAAGTNMIDNVVVTPRASQTIATSFDEPGRTFTTSEIEHWDADAIDVTEGATSLRASWLAEGETAWVQTVVGGPSILSFAWRTTATGSFSVNGTTMRTLTGIDTDWRRESIYLPSGSHTIRWSHTRPTSTTSPLRALWLDDFDIEQLDPESEALLPRPTVQLDPAVLNISGNTTQWRYLWASDAFAEPLITRALGTAVVEVLAPGDNGVIMRPGESWTVMVEGYNAAGVATGDVLVGRFTLGYSTSDVMFQGWAVR